MFEQLIDTLTKQKSQEEQIGPTEQEREAQSEHQHEVERAHASAAAKPVQRLAVMTR